jgi:hypothetical protein
MQDWCCFLDFKNVFNLYSPRSWRVDNADIDFKRSSPILFFCAVIPRSLAAGIGAGRAKQIYLMV